MASRQQLRVVMLLLLMPAFGLVHASPSRHLVSRPLHDFRSAATASAGSTDAVGIAGGPRNAANADAGRSLRLMQSSISPPPLASPPWELELAPYLAEMSPPRDPNTTALRGPPRLAGVFKGSWLRTAYGPSLRPQDMLSSERGVIILRMASEEEEEEDPGSRSGGGPHGASGMRQLPGGLHELRGELIIRDGESVTDHDLRFRLRGTYVPAAGTVHAVLEPTLPQLGGLRAELDPNPSGRPGGLGPGGLGWAAGSRAADGGGGAQAAAAVAAVGRQKGGAAAAGGGVGSGSGYREALRTAARNLVVLGPAWHRTLMRHPPPPPRPPRSSRMRRAFAEEEEHGRGRLLPPPPPPSPPRPPLELALLQACELRADFRVYYKGDPAVDSHVEFLRLDQPVPPPSPPPTRGSRGGGGDGLLPAAAPSRVVTAAMAAAAAQQGGPGAAAAAAGGGGGGLPAIAASAPAAASTSAAARQLQRRRLAADQEIYHSTETQLHSDAAAASAAGVDDDGAAAAAASTVYGMPSGMDPHDPDLVLVGLVMSTNCDFALHFNASSVHLERYYKQAVRYSGLVAVVTIAQIVLSVSQAESSSTPSSAARMSLYSVTMQAILDAYQCLLHLTGALVVDALFAAFASLAFLQFLLFAVFEMRQTLLVWRAQRINAVGDFWSVRQDMSAVYFRFYGLLLMGLLLMFQCRSQLALLVLGLHSWWLPQLLHSATSDTRPPLKAQYVWGMSALRLISPLYFFGCPSNLLRVEQHPGVCVALVGWVALQAALLTAQIRLGPRVFIPRAFLPQRYDYHRPASKREMGIEEPQQQQPAAAAASSSSPTSALSSSAAASAGGATSSSSPWWWWRWWPFSGARAGLSPPLRRLASWFRRSSASAFSAAGAVGVAARSAAAAALHRAASAGGRRSGSGGGGADGAGDEETGHGSKECVICMNPVPLVPPNARMLTPCGHFFHEPCLTRWMDVKMDCPTCRRPLPPA